MGKAKGELVGQGGPLNVDDIADEINSIYNTQVRNEVSAAIHIGELFNSVKDTLPHGDFDVWCDRHFEFSRTTRARWMAIAVFDGYAKKKLGIDIRDSKWSIAALYELVSKKCPEDAKKKLVAWLKKGEVVSRTGVLEVVKSCKAKANPGASDEEDEDDGKFDCLRCNERFERAEFHDPDAPINCRRCQEAATRELDEEDAARASEDSRESPFVAEAVSLTSAWSKAAESERHEMIQAASAEGYCSVVGMTEVLCKITEEKEDRTPKEILDEAWSNCTEKVQRSWLRVNKIKDKFFSPKTKFVPPTIDEVQEHIDKNGYQIDAEEFVAHYTTNGWKVGVGGNPMKSWKTACTTWQKRREKDRRAAHNGADMENDEFRS
jgi:hypothetical protein